jgi:predicted nucleic acid-binding protein
MTGYVLDSCTLINLYCAWGSVANLKAFPDPFCVGAAVAAEIHCVREFDSRGHIVGKKLSTPDLARNYALHELKPSAQEVNLMVQLAKFLGDGEAEGLAIAASRDMVFCTDDGAIRKVVEAQGIQVSLASTPTLLQVWAAQSPDNLNSLPNMVKRVTDLCKFRPHRSDAHLSWWMRNLDA